MPNPHLPTPCLTCGRRRRRMRLAEAGSKSATVADLPNRNLSRDLAEAEAAIADTKRAYYDALNQRHRAIRALAREREELSNAKAKPPHTRANGRAT